MRIGLVSPYSFDVPGGVQLHVRDLATYLMAGGHEVSVLAPSDGDCDLPSWVTAVHGAVPIRYNGSVARLAFGPRTASRVSRWIEQGGFDVLHVHEPLTPSVSLLALRTWDGPTVGTFHTATDRSRALQLAGPFLRPALEKITGRVAVSQEAKRTLVEHFGGDAVVIPNGVYVDQFSSARPAASWQGTPERPTVAFLGRVGEPRKGFSVLLDALPRILAAVPGIRLLVAGPGQHRALLDDLTPPAREAVEFLGVLSEEDKARLLRSVDLYVAPNTGGESFGIILIEAMSAGAPVVASNLDAFSHVLGEDGSGELFVNEQPDSLAEAVVSVLKNPPLQQELRHKAFARASDFDWSRVGHEILNVYSTVIAGHDPDRPAWRLYGRS